MYESFYDLTANPFRLVPDARFFYPSAGHKRGLAYLRYGLHQGQGFVVVTGRPGTGKSTLVQTLFTELSGQSLVVAGLSSTNLEADDILQAVGHSFDVYAEHNNKASLLIGIEKFLKERARQGKRVVLIVDEAQNLPRNSLEELRMLSNFQLGDQPLLQIMLLGQQQLQEMLSRPDMEQMCQRVIASFHLKPMTAEETRAYIAHRLQCVGWRGDPLITGKVLSVIFAASRGIPRLINIFCDRLFLAASLDKKHEIDLALAESVVAELKEEATGAFGRVNIDVNELDELTPLSYEKGTATESNDHGAEVSPTDDSGNDESSAEQLGTTVDVPQVDSESPELQSGMQTTDSTPLEETPAVDSVSENLHEQSSGDEIVVSQPLAEDSVAAHVDVTDEAKSRLADKGLDSSREAANRDDIAATNISEMVDEEPPATEKLSEREQPQVEQPRQRKRGVLLPLVFTMVAIALVAFLSEDVRLFIQNTKLDDIKTMLSQQLTGGDSATPQTKRVDSDQIEHEAAVLPAAEELIDPEDTVPVVEVGTQEESEATPEPDAQIENDGSSRSAPAQQPVATAANDSTPPVIAAAVVAVKQQSTVVNNNETALTQMKPQTEAPVTPIKVEQSTAQAAQVSNKPVTAAAADRPVAEPVVVTTTETLPPPVVKSATEVEQEKKPEIDAVPVPSLAAIVDLPVEPVIVGQTEKFGISDSALSDLVSNLASNYEDGDLKGFIRLFAKNAVADGAKGRKKIKKDYRSLFKATATRKMDISEMAWQWSPEGAMGNGIIQVTVFQKKNGEPLSQRGVIDLKVVKAGEILLIETMSHNLE